MSKFLKRPNIQKKFAQQTKGVTEAEKRLIEQSLLQPDPLVKYSGEHPKHKSQLDALSVNIVFSNKDEMDLMARHITISENVKGEQYITNIEFLLDLIRKYEAQVHEGTTVPVNVCAGTAPTKCVCGKDSYVGASFFGTFRSELCPECLEKVLGCRILAMSQTSKVKE